MAESESDAASSQRTVRIGMALGLVAAVSYSVTNLALRKVAVAGDTDLAFWISFWKAVPAAILAWGWIAWLALRGQNALPPRKLVLPLIAAGCLMQFGGNVLFQISLGLGGLVLTVPMVFAFIISVGALLGRIFLGDAMTPRTLLAIGVMLVSIVCLSLGAADATGQATNDTSTMTILTACAVAALSGASYGTNGVVIRSVMLKHRLPLATTLVLFSTVGVVALGGLSLWRVGLDRMLATPGADLSWMLFAGSTNAIAFFCVGASLRRISVNQTNLLNATQNALCSLGGILLFSEPATAPLLAGVALTVVGILVLDKS